MSSRFETLPVAGHYRFFADLVLERDFSPCSHSSLSASAL
jgi:hypothetical protein